MPTKKPWLKKVVMALALFLLCGAILGVPVNSHDQTWCSLCGETGIQHNWLVSPSSVTEATNPWARLAAKYAMPECTHQWHRTRNASMTNVLGCTTGVRSSTNNWTWILASGRGLCALEEAGRAENVQLALETFRGFGSRERVAEQHKFVRELARGKDGGVLPLDAAAAAGVVRKWAEELAAIRLDEAALGSEATP